MLPVFVAKGLRKRSKDMWEQRQCSCTRFWLEPGCIVTQALHWMPRSGFARCCPHLGAWISIHDVSKFYSYNVFNVQSNIMLICPGERPVSTGTPVCLFPSQLQSLKPGRGQLTRGFPGTLSRKMLEAGLQEVDVETVSEGTVGLCKRWCCHDQAVINLNWHFYRMRRMKRVFWIGFLARGTICSAKRISLEAVRSYITALLFCSLQRKCNRGRADFAPFTYREHNLLFFLSWYQTQPLHQDVGERRGRAQTLPLCQRNEPVRYCCKTNCGLRRSLF